MGTKTTVTDMQLRSFDRNYRWLVLRALRALRSVKVTNLDDKRELLAVYRACREHVLTLAIEEGFDPSNLDLLQATSIIRGVVVALVEATGKG
jgi:hypothetical protein